jgi:hypothetical protein
VVWRRPSCELLHPAANKLTERMVATRCRDGSNCIDTFREKS